MKYTNKVRINGEVFTHTIEAVNYKEALEINKKRKVAAKSTGREIFGKLEKS